MANLHTYRCTYRGGTFAVGDRPLTYGQTIVLTDDDVARKVKTTDLTGGFLEYLGEGDATDGYFSTNIQELQDGRNQALKRNYLPLVTLSIPLADTAFDTANKMAVSMLSPSRRFVLDKVVAKAGLLPSCSTGAAAFNLDNRVHMLLTKGDPGVSTQITTYGYTDDNGILETLGLPLTNTVLDSFQAAQDTIYLGSTSKFGGVFVEMVAASLNSTAGFVSAVRYWNGSTWTAFTNVADYTQRTGITLGGDGWIAWFEKPTNWSNESPVASAHTLVNSSTALTTGVYWVALQFTGNFDADTEINRVWIPEEEPLAEMELIAISGGAGASPDAFNSVIKQDDTVLTEVSAGITAGLLNWSNPNLTDDALYLGYDAPFGGALFDVGATVNAAASVATVSYWNGAEWVSAGVVDGTIAVGGKTLSGDGIMSWAMPPDWAASVATSAMMDSQTLPATTSTSALYWVKLTWDTNNLTDQFDITNIYPVRSPVLPIEFNAPVNCEIAPSDYLNIYVGEVEADADVLTGLVLELVGADI